MEKSGFLFSHVCKRPASSACRRCDKDICDKHVSALESEQVCTSCFKKHLKRTKGRYDADEPYYYSSYYYQGYGYYGRGYWGHDHFDDADFTEADGAAFHDQGDDGWESDMGGS